MDLFGFLWTENGETAEVVFKCLSSSIVVYPFDDEYNPSLTKLVGLDWNRVILTGNINDDAYAYCSGMTVYGYIRIHAEQQLFMQIPSDVQQTVADYFEIEGTDTIHSK